MIFGKLIGAFMGYLAGGLIGAIVGLIMGHFFDRGLRFDFGFGGDRAQVQRVFFETTFRVAGHLAKADGRISEAEVAQTEQLMRHMGLTPEHRREAIALFKEGAKPEFQPEPEVQRFLRLAGHRVLLRQLLLEYLVAVALADGEVHAAEDRVLLAVARLLGINERRFRQMMDMLLAQAQFGGTRQRRAQAPPRRDELADAYRALGVHPQDSDAHIKRAYRRLMSQHHPDKLIAKGVPDDMVKMATEKSQEIRAAYDLICQSRKST